MVKLSVEERRQAKGVVCLVQILPSGVFWGDAHDTQGGETMSGLSMILSSNKPDAANPATALWLTTGALRRRVAELGSLGKKDEASLPDLMRSDHRVLDFGFVNRKIRIRRFSRSNLGSDVLRNDICRSCFTIGDWIRDRPLVL